ncbi:VOC family protein [Spirillospora sp. NPDC029432]|uniref:VOC family protein n=1 Tax=Spirillospora sp. NPDC029432 TaxID=3154599 RepID=UPI0034553FAB
MEWTLEVVPVPVTDIDKAKRFYAEQVGFTVDHDTRQGETRIVQLTPPGSGCSIVIGTVVTMEPGSLRGVQLVVPDIEAARARLLEGGVDAGRVHHFEESGPVDGPGGRWNSFVNFSDPDGNQWVVQESPADR